MFEIEKRDGRIEEFIPEKVVVSCVKAGADLEAARDISNEIKRELREKTSSTVLRNQILDLLGKKDPEWKKNWLVYDKAVKKR
ncbi:MAG: ATP cone domain-containing protein [Euryarchaeota archaeon]|nr:ATP cone domain-containing protein [Euryarchaeota archaeon]